ncbi:MAG: Ni/Fe hydrogenase subunit gamma [Proteobacteria bacterium]|jgi:NAD(P)H-flavin reductase|nr:FAD/NAD(P)-binding protein [Alphaproteobacteria bacterium]NCC03078.1 Ni/Fe hydrogenase subunit gamma [Pseudomonadota bacterium]
MTFAASNKKDTSCACYSGSADPMHPRPFKVVDIWRELSDTFSMSLVPEDGGPVLFEPGQFNMLYVYGVGEIPISVSGDPTDRSKLVHTTRAVGNVSKALDALKAGDVVGVRGPFGSVWPLDVAEGKDLVFVAGGIGLAPLRPAIYAAMANRHRFGNIAVLYGARTPEDILFAKELLRWRARFDIDVQVTVDRATGNWQGKVGLVTKVIASGGFDPNNSVAYTCGPEVMMLHVANALKNRGMGADQIYLSMERNMKCGVGFCGHCQWGSFFICRDGPVFRYDQIADRLDIKEL